MSGTIDRLIYMANQIARNLAVHRDPAAAVADHIATFWDPRMKAMIFDQVRTASEEGLTPIASAAIRRLLEQGPPSPQSAATLFNHVDEIGHSDAG